MDTRDGQIRTAEQVRAMPFDEGKFFVEMATPPTPKQIIRARVGRNDLCPCGSGKKFKKCHLRPR